MIEAGEAMTISKSQERRKKGEKELKIGVAIENFFTKSAFKKERANPRRNEGFGM